MVYKKIACAVMSLVLMVSLLGCAGENNVQNNVTNQTDGEIVVHWMVYGEKYKDSDAVFAAFNKELKKYFKDTTVEFDVVSKEHYKAKWDMKMATNESVDLAWIGNDLFNYTEEVKKGSFTAIDYLLSTVGQDLQENIPEELWALQVRDGNTFGIPVEGALYRKELDLVTKAYYMENFGDAQHIEEVNTSSRYTTLACYESFEPFLANAMDTKSIGTGVSYESFRAIADKGLEGIYGAYSPFVIKIFDDELNVYNKYELDLYRDYFYTMSKWYKLGYIRSDVADVIDPTSEDGKQGGSIMFLDEYVKERSDEQIATEYEAIYIPLENDKYIAYDSCRNSVVIPKSAKNPQRAMQIINLLVSDEGKALYQLLVNGLEKTHYISLDDDTIVRRRNEDELLYALSPYTVADTFQNLALAPDQFERMNSANESAILSKLFGFNLDTRMISTELAKVDLVIDEYIDTLSQGVSEDWESEYGEFVAKLKEAGSDKVVAEIQRQIDEFQSK